MAFRVEITLAAKRDADDILDWLISQEAGEAGVRWFRGLEQAVASLSEFPKRCALAPENPFVPFETRQLVYGKKRHLYRILFTIENDVVYVLRIRHGRRKQVEPQQ
jgi:plasmid stabilization system protein ParE